MEYIPGAIESVITQSANTFKSVLVTGARQTGKSTLIKHLFSDAKEVNFDDPFAEEQAKNNPGMFMDLNEPPVFFDEIQYVPNLLAHELKTDIHLYSVYWSFLYLQILWVICTLYRKFV